MSVCVCILSICYCMPVWCRQSASQSFHLDAAHRLAEAKIGLPASTRIWWKGQILGCCENVLLSPLLVLQIPDIFRRSSGLVKPPSTISNQSPCNHYLILLALLMGMFPTCVLKCVTGFQEWAIASPGSLGPSVESQVMLLHSVRISQPFSQKKKVLARQSSRHVLAGFKQSPKSWIDWIDGKWLLSSMGNRK